MSVRPVVAFDTCSARLPRRFARLVGGSLLVAAMVAGFVAPAGAAAPAAAAPAAAAPAAATSSPLAPTSLRSAAASQPAVAPHAGDSPAQVPPIPVVSRDITAGQSADALYQQAVALSSVGASQAPLEASLAQAQHVLDSQTVLANQAGAAAAAATARAATADASAAAARSLASDLQTALREAALRIYTGATTVVPTNPGDSADAINDAAAYEDTILSPGGILAQRKREARVARTAAGERDRQQAAALHDEGVARSALAAAAGATDQIRRQVSVLDASMALMVSAERAQVSSQAGHSLTSGSALDFTPSTPLPTPLATTPVALGWAFSELGKPYAWGSTGPDAFDCSGLTEYSWQQAGVAIPRVAEDQDAWTVPVPLSQLLPGDLVFYGTTDIHHVGMYIGGGLMINAPHTGDVVRISPIWWADLAGFGRVHDVGLPTPVRILPGVAHPAPAAVIPTVGSVPSESTPPPGYVPLPGATSPVATPTTLPQGPSTTTQPTTATPSTTAPGGTTTTIQSGPTTTTTPPAGSGATTTTSSSLPATTGTGVGGTQGGSSPSG